MDQQEREINALVNELCNGRRVEFIRAMIICLQIELKRIKICEETKGKPQYAELYKVVKSQKSFVQAQRAKDEHFPSVDEYG